MNKQRKTSHILNVFQYDADGHVVLPASLTLGIAPGSGDNNSKVPTTAWVRTYVSGLSYQGAITLTTSGTSGAATLVGNTLNIPTYTLAGLGGQAALSGTGFVKISGTTISYDNNTYATQTYVGTQIANLVDSSPATLDTLNELAAALGDDPNFATTVATSIGTKQAQLNGTGFVKVTGTTVSYDNSTYLTTGTAGTTYVPYTGGTANVNLGVYDLDGGNININGAGSGGGALRLKQFGSSEANREGYNSISTLTSGVFYFTSSASVPNFKNFALNPSGLTDNTLRTYALPDASGTIALTSNLSSYLPLSGGTLTGPLAGTTSSWNGFAINATPPSVGTAQTFVRYISAGSDWYIGSESSVAGNFFGGASAYASVFFGTNPFQFITGGVKRFEIATGGVTSTVGFTGTSATFNHNDAPTVKVQRNGGTDSNTVIEFTNASRSFFIGSNGTVMGLGGTSGSIGSQPLQISSTGAATFSSTISAGGGITTNGSITSTVGGTSELRLQGGGYGGGYNTSLRSMGGAIGILQFGNNGENYVLIGNTNTSANTYLSFRINCTTEATSSGTEAFRITSSGVGNSSTTFNGTSTFLSNVLIGTTNADVGGSVLGTVIRSNGTMTAAINMSSPANYTSPIAADRMNTAGDGLMYGMWRQGIFQAGIGATNGQDMYFYTGDGGNSSQPIRMTIKRAGDVGIGITSPLQTAANRTVLTVNGTLTSLINLSVGGVLGAYWYYGGSSSQIYSVGQLDFNTSNATGFTFNPNGQEAIRITNAGTLFQKGYVGGTLLGGFSVIGTLSAINTGNRYLHVKINTIGSMMFWIKIFGYVYTTTIIEGMCGGYIGGGTGGVNQGFANGNIVTQYQNNGFLEVVVDTLNNSTTNRWGSITFLGGTDAIATVQPLEIMAYSWTASTTMVY